VLQEACRYGQVQFFDVQGNLLAAVPEAVSFTAPTLGSRCERIHVHAVNAQRLSPAILQVDSRPVFCQVLKVVYDDPSVSSHEEAVQYWIDPKRLIVLQQNFAEIDPATNQRLQWTYTIDSVKLNQPPPQWLRESTEQQADHEVPNWIGRTAPDFALSDLEGRHFSLAKARGKVVVLDFWATWCSPCKEEMPTIEKLGRDYSSEEVEVWGVNHESPSSAREWLERSHSRIRTLADPDWEVFKLYEVEAIPVVVVIGREGKVASYYVGMQSERALHAAIESALQ
jgi:peroxiredoxin